MLSFPRHYVVEQQANLRARDLLLELLTGFGYEPVLQGTYDNIVAAYTATVASLGFESIVPIPFFSLQVSPQTFWIAPGPSRRCCDSPADALRPSFVSTRTSRGPPVPVFLT